MPKLTAIVHTHNDALRLGRTLDSLRVCDEVLVVDHGSEDETVRIARSHGATVKKGLPGVEHGAYIMDARHDWVLVLRPDEALSESLEATLYDWRAQKSDDDAGYNVVLRGEHGREWRPLGRETRLANRQRINWTTGELPPPLPDAPTLEGDLLRFAEPKSSVRQAG